MSSWWICGVKSPLALQIFSGSKRSSMMQTAALWCIYVSAGLCIDAPQGTGPWCLALPRSHVSFRLNDNESTNNVWNLLRCHLNAQVNGSRQILMHLGSLSKTYPSLNYARGKQNASDTFLHLVLIPLLISRAFSKKNKISRDFPAVQTIWVSPMASRIAMQYQHHN